MADFQLSAAFSTNVIKKDKYDTDIGKHEADQKVFSEILLLATK
jgi:hypothetical protein